MKELYPSSSSSSVAVAEDDDDDGTDQGKKIKSTKENIKKISRLYQITPSNDSLNVLLKKSFTSAQGLLKKSFTSAQDIVEFTKEDFLNGFAKEFPFEGRKQNLSTVRRNR